MTAQIGDTLAFAGRQFGLASEPLARWLQRRRNRHLRLRGRTTANTRGYVCAWEVEDGRLYLKEFNGRLVDGSTMDLAQLFPGQEGPVLAGWFSGALVCPMGKLLKYEHSGYASVREFDLILWFIEGRLVEQRLNRNWVRPGDRDPDFDADIEEELDLDSDTLAPGGESGTKAPWLSE